MDGVIAPLLPDMRRNEILDAAVTRALDETLGLGTLGDRLLSFRIWRRDGTVLYSKDKNVIGRRLDLEENVQAAFAGAVLAELDTDGDAHSQSQAATDKPLLKIYNPILEPWSGEIVAVSEFHEIATDFERSLAQARLRSWLVVALVTFCFFLVLSLIVFRGSRIIDRQSDALKERVSELSDLLAKNRRLHARVRRASRRAAAVNENYLRRIGADLHDGPAQLIALAALRLDSQNVSDVGHDDENRAREISSIKGTLDEAMREIRSICNGLVLPQIEAAELPEILKRVARAHQQRTGSMVAVTVSSPPQSISSSAKICIFRFVQEALNNAYRHGKSMNQSVKQYRTDEGIVVEVADGGIGFNPKRVRPEGLGLAGLRDRVESLGGQFSIVSTPGKGTRVMMSLDVQEMEQA